MSTLFSDLLDKNGWPYIWLNVMAFWKEVPSLHSFYENSYVMKLLELGPIIWYV